MERTHNLSACDAAVTCVCLRYAAISATEALQRILLARDQVDRDLRSLEAFASALAVALVAIGEGGQCRALVSDEELDAFKRLVDRCRPMWLLSERGSCHWFTLPAPAEALQIAAAVADGGSMIRHGRLGLCEIEAAAVGHIAAHRPWLERISDRQKAEAMQPLWMQVVGCMDG